MITTAKNTLISPNFLLWKFLERHSLRRVSDDSPETLGKMCLSTKFPHQVIGRNYGILRSVPFLEGISLTHFRPMFPFYTPWKHHQIKGFLIFSGGMKWDHWNRLILMTPSKKTSQLNYSVNPLLVSML